jgi:hypothetical protein
VREPGDFAAAADFFERHCRRVRVMPFIEGIPCSIHGIVFRGEVAVFRPIELLTLRRREDHRFVYAGAASYWDPGNAETERIREVARSVGEGLSFRHGYRGAFTVDGVLGADGWVPTELNPRMGSAFPLLTAGASAVGAPDVPLVPLALAVQQGERLDYRPRELERLVLEASAVPAGAGGVVLSGRRPCTEGRPIKEDGCGYRVAGRGEQPDGALVAGPSDAGGFVSFRPRADRVPRGASFAPRMAAALRLADAELGTGLGTLDPARSAHEPGVQ